MHRRGKPFSDDLVYDWPLWTQYLLSVGLTAAALLARSLFEPVLGDRVPFLTLFIVLMPLAMLVRVGPFLTAAVAGLLGALFLFVPPRFSFHAAGSKEVVQGGLFLFAVGAAALTAWFSRRAHVRIQSADAMLAAFVDESPTCKWITGPDGRIEYMNKAMASALGRKPEEVLGKTHAEIMPPEMARVARDRIEQVRRTGQPCASFEEIEPMGSKGERRIMEWRRFVIKAQGDGRVLVAGMANDVTEKARLQRALEESERRLEAALSSSEAVAWGWNIVDDRLDQWDAAYRDMYGFGPEVPAQFKIWIERVHPDDRQRVMDRVAVMLATPGDDVWDEEFRILHPVRGLRWIGGRGRCTRDASGKPIRMTGVNLDVTERRNAEIELESHRDRLAEMVEQRTAEALKAQQHALLAQRMAAVGTLAAGLAHDMKNVLLPLGARVDSLLSVHALSKEAKADIAVVAALLDHLKAMAKNLSLFASDPEHNGAEAVTDLAAWSAQVKGFINASTESGIDVRWEVPAGIPHAAIAPHRLTQCVQNLVHNARDAILSSRGPDWRQRGLEQGRILIEARHENGSGAITVKVADNGSGMSQEVMRRCIEPFFTTKDRPSIAGSTGGTGLGLSLAYSIIERAGGEMRIESELGKGTAITLVIPTANSGNGPSSAITRGCARVTIEDKRVRAAVTELLRSMRFEIMYGEPIPDSPSVLWVTEASEASPQKAAQFLSIRPGQRVIALGGDERWRDAGAIVCDKVSDLASLRKLLQADSPPGK